MTGESCQGELSEHEREITGRKMSVKEREREREERQGKRKIKAGPE